MEKIEIQSKQASLAFKIINSPISIIIVLIIFAIFLMIYNRYLVNSMTLYSFTGFNDDMTIINGTIYTSYNINYFGDSKIVYTGEDINIYDYRVGYFIKDSDKYHTIAMVKSIEDIKSGASLKEIVESVDFSFTETSKDALYFSKKNIENLKDLTFRITGTDKDKKEIEIEIPLTVTKISK